MAQVIQYQDNFDSETVGSTPAAFSSGQVMTNGAVSGTNAFGVVNPSEATEIHFTAAVVNAAADHGILYHYKVPAADTFSPAMWSPILRLGDDGSCYLYFIERTHWRLFFRAGNGGFQELIEGNAVCANPGTVIWIRAEAVGFGIRFRTWVDGTTEPTSWTEELGDTHITTPGRPALYANNAVAGMPGFDDVTVYTVTNGDSTPTPTTPTPTTPTPTPTTPTPTTPTPTPTTPTPTPTTPTPTTVFVPINNVAFYYPKLGWFYDAANVALQTVNTGNIIKFGFTTLAVGDVAIKTDPATNGNTTLAVALDGGNWVFVSPSQTLTTIFAAVPVGSHEIIVMLSSCNQAVNHWGSIGVVPTNCLRVFGFVFPYKTTTHIPSQFYPIRTKRGIVYGDSITQGVNTGSPNAVVGEDATVDYITILAKDLDAEFSVVGFGSQGYTQGGSDGATPALFTPNNDAASSWNKYDCTNTRLAGDGSFLYGASEPLDYVIIFEGTNDRGADQFAVRTAAQGLLPMLRKAAPRARIFQCVPFGNSGGVVYCQSALTLAVNNYLSTNRFDNITSLLDIDADDLGASTNIQNHLTDSLHPNVVGHVLLANALYQKILTLTAVAPTTPATVFSFADDGVADAVGAFTNIIMPQYLTTDVADQYFYQRLNSDVWFAASDNDKKASLIQSTRAIDGLNFVGVKYRSDQKLAFPRKQADRCLHRPLQHDRAPWLNYVIDGELQAAVPIENRPGIPQDILIACCENAIVLLDGFDFEMELSLLNTQATNYATVRETYDRNLVVTHLRSGIASGVAWMKLKPWLADTQSFTVSRVN